MHDVVDVDVEPYWSYTYGDRWCSLYYLVYGGTRPIGHDGIVVAIVRRGRGSNWSCLFELSFYFDDLLSQQEPENGILLQKQLEA